MKALSPDHKFRTDEQEDGLATLLLMNGYIAEVGEGCWVKIEATRARPSAEKPAGILYCLTFHSPEGDRLLGYDNTHAVRSSAGPGGKAKPPDDHMHSGTWTKRYNYSDAATLLDDFWGEVNRIIAIRKFDRENRTARVEDRDRPARGNPSADDGDRQRAIPPQTR